MRDEMWLSNKDVHKKWTWWVEDEEVRMALVRNWGGECYYDVVVD